MAAPDASVRAPADPAERRRSVVLACLMAAMAMVALEATIVATAAPQIVAKLGGVALYGWVFSAFLLTQAVTTPLWGRLADLGSRRRVLTAGLSLFLAGSLLCGSAPSMPWLVAARVVQGLGAGCVQPICVTVVGDLYEGEARTRAQGRLSSIWGPSALVAPVLGSLLLRTLGWPWVFWINLAPGAVALAGVAVLLREPARARIDERRPLDFAGAAAFAILAAAVLLALGRIAAVGQGRWGWAAAFALIAVLAAPVFLALERRAQAPVIPLALWSRPVIAGANAVTLIGCMALMGVTLLLPIYVQGVLGGSSLTAGFTLTTMAVGWPIAAVNARRLHARFGLRATLVLGAASLALGSTLFCTLRPAGSVLWAFVGSFASGAGLGLLTMTAIVLIQGVASAGERGSASSSNIFARSLGGALGAALLSAIFAAGSARLSGTADAATLLRSPVGSGAAAATLNASLHGAFLAVLLLAAIVFGLAFVVDVGASERANA